MSQNRSVRSVQSDRSVLLSTFLQSVWGTPYNLGTWDCAIFIAAWADYLTGSKHLEEYADTYRTEHGGRHLHAPRGLAAIIRQELTAAGWSEISNLKSQINLLPGDIVLTDLDHPGIWDGATIVAQPARAAGLLHLHPRHASVAFRAPESRE